MAKRLPDLDQYLRPSTMICANCRGTAIVYPSMHDEGCLYCPTCSPKFLQPFRMSMLANERKEHGLTPLMRIKTRILKALLGCCDDPKNHRKAITSIGRSETCVVATDTHILAWIGKLTSSQPNKDGVFEGGPTSTTGLLEEIKATEAKLAGKAKDDAAIDVEILPQGDAQYPSAARVVPLLETCRAPVYYQVEILQKALDCARALATNGKDSKPVIGLFHTKIDPMRRPTRFIAYDANPGYGVEDQDKVFIEGAIMPICVENATESAPTPTDPVLPEDKREKIVMYGHLADELLKSLRGLPFKLDDPDAKEVVLRAVRMVNEGVPTEVGD